MSRISAFETRQVRRFALMDENYSKENPNWIVFHVGEGEWRNLAGKLKIVGDCDFMPTLENTFGWRNV